MTYTLLSSTPLAANDTYTGSWFDISLVDISTLLVLATADQTGTLYVDYSEDKTNITISMNAACNATVASPVQVGTYGNEADLNVAPFSRYYRIRFVNGATLQTKFSLSVRVVPA